MYAKVLVLEPLRSTQKTLLGGF